MDVSQYECLIDLICAHLSKRKLFQDLPIGKNDFQPILFEKLSLTLHRNCLLKTLRLPLVYVHGSFYEFLIFRNTYQVYLNIYQET